MIRCYFDKERNLQVIQKYIIYEKSRRTTTRGLGLLIYCNMPMVLEGIEFFVVTTIKDIYKYYYFSCPLPPKPAGFGE